MAGEIQLNSTTFATESGGTITVANVDSATNRTNLGLGSMATQNANAVAITGGNITGGTIGSGVVFPTGHIIQTVSKIYNTFTLFSSATFSAIASNAFEKSITTSVANSQILVTIFLSGAGSTDNALAALQLKITESVTSLDQKLDDVIGSATDSSAALVHPATLVYLHAPAQSSGTTLTYIPQFASRNSYTDSAFINNQISASYGCVLLLQEIAP